MMRTQARSHRETFVRKLVALVKLAKLDRVPASAYHLPETGKCDTPYKSTDSIPVICEASAPMRLPLEPVARLRRALFPSQDNQFGWRLASVTVSLVSVGLIALTVAYRLRGAELPPALWVGLLASFATVVVLFSKFLFWAQKEGGQFQGAFTTTEREFHSVFENALDAILILDDQAICREANPAAESALRNRDARNCRPFDQSFLQRIPTNSGKAGKRFSTTNSSRAMQSS